MKSAIEFIIEDNNINNNFKNVLKRENYGNSRNT